MKAIMMSIRPEWIAKILNGEKTIEIRKKFPSDYVGWVYIYCTKSKPYLFHEKGNVWGDDIYELTNDSTSDLPNYKHAYVVGGALNGKVVGRFQITNSELEIENVCVEALANCCGGYEYQYYGGSTGIDVREKSCLDEFDLTQYLGIGKEGIPLGYAIHITKLEIFDKPKEISEFYGAFTQKRYERIFGNNAVELDEKYGGLRQPTKRGYEYTYPLTRAPQSYCFIEV